MRKPRDPSVQGTTRAPGIVSPAKAPIAHRWVDAPPSTDTDGRIATLLADVPPPPALPPERLAAIAAQLPRRALPTRLPVRLGVRWALAISFLLGGVSAVWARKQVAHLWDQITTAQDNPSKPGTPGPRKPRGSLPAEPLEPVPTAKQEELPVRPLPGRGERVGVREVAPLAAAPGDNTPEKEAAPSSHPLRKPQGTLLTKREQPPVRPRPPEAGEGRGEGTAPSSSAGIPRHLPRPPAAAPPPPADDPLTALTPPPQSALPLPPPAPETADILMPLPPRAPATPPPGSALHEETALVRAAIESLRVLHRPSDALASLAEHRRRFPMGALAADAQMLRVEALIALGRRNEALVALDDHRLAGESPGGALQVTRAELLAARNCREALAAFDDLLDTTSSSPTTTERALRGRAICHTRLGDSGAARRDWETYLQRFPNGRFREEAQTNLNRQ